MTTPHNRLFGVRSLSAMVMSFFEEQRLNSFYQDLFLRGRRLDPISPNGVVEWDEVQAHRHLAPFTGRDSPFPLVESTQRILRKAAMANVKLSKKIPAARLFDERAPGLLRADANLVVDQELRDLVKLVMNSVEYMAANTLNGSLIVNNTLVPGSSVAFTITSTPNTYTATTNWATLSTRIVSQELSAMKQDHLQASGMLPRQMIIPGAIQDSLAANTEIQNLLRNQAGTLIAESAATLFGQALDGFNFGGLAWWVNEAGYVPVSGSFTKFHPATDAAFLLPDDGELTDVLGMALGQGYVPGNEVGPAAAGASLISPAPTRGMYSYAVRTINPVGIELFVGFVGLPVLLFPSGVTVVDTTP